MSKQSKLKEFENNLRFMIDISKKSIVLLQSYDYGYVLEAVSSIINSDKVLIYNNATRHIYEINSESTPLTTKTTSLGLFIPQYILGKLKNPSQDNVEGNISNKTLLIAKITESMLEDDGDTNEDHLLARLQDFVYRNSKLGLDERKVILLIASTHFDINGLEHICERLSVPLPDKDDIHEELDIELGKDKEENPIFKYPFAADFRRGGKTKDNKKDLIDALYGMSLYDIRELLRSLMAESKGRIKLDLNGKKLPERVIARKKQLVKNSGLLEVIDLKNKDQYHECVGGIDGLRDYLKDQKKKISSVFLHSKLPKPKGILLVGAPGCGKSESAKAVASILGLPIFRLNIGDLLGHKYGQSENRFNEALRTADASAPCVLWIDEIEKAFAGAGNEQDGDDTLTHIIGRFLTWMQEHETLVYLVATANDLSKMKPELLRKGRWDEIFYLSYPESLDIKEIIAKKRKEYNIDLYDQGVLLDDVSGEDGKIIKSAIPDDLIKTMEGMSGAEIVSILMEAANKDFPYSSNSEDQEIRIPITLNTLKNSVNMISSQKKQDEEKDLTTKINDEILELKLKHLGYFDSQKEETARKLLKEKYQRENKNNFESKGYRPANKILK